MSFLRTLRLPAVLTAACVLLAALGGTAMAAKLITGKDVRNGSLTGADVKNKSLTGADVKDRSLSAADLNGSLRALLDGRTGPQGVPGAAGAKGESGPQGPQGPAGTPNGYTKSEADAAFLGKGGKAADADRLDGTDGDDLVAGDAAIGFNSVSKAIPSPSFDLIAAGDMGVVEAGCNAGGSKAMVFNNTSGAELLLTRTRIENAGPSDVSLNVIAPGATQNLVSLASNFQLTLQISRRGANALASSDFSTIVISATDGATCDFSAHAIDSERDAGLVIIP